MIKLHLKEIVLHRSGIIFCAKHIFHNSPSAEGTQDKTRRLFVYFVEGRIHTSIK